MSTCDFNAPTIIAILVLSTGSKDLVFELKNELSANETESEEEAEVDEEKEAEGNSGEDAEEDTEAGEDLGVHEALITRDLTTSQEYNSRSR